MSNGGRPRGSIFTGLLLILLGVLFLLYRFHPELGIGHLLHFYWPVLLILWGVAKLIDYFAAQRAGDGRPAILSGGEAALMVLVIIVLLGMGALDWIGRRNPDWKLNSDLFSQNYSQTEQLTPKTIPAGAQVSIHTDRGDITVHAGDGNEIRVGVDESASGSSESAAHTRMNEVSVVIEQSGSGYSVHPVYGGSSDSRVTVDLDVELPKKVSVNVTTKHGDINITGLAGTATASTDNGDLEIHEIGSDVSAAIQKGDAHITDVTGDVRLTGKGTEIEVGDVGGDATLDGDFYGPIRVRNVTKTTHFTSQKSDLTLLHLTGRLELDSGQIEISDVAGFAKLVTHNKDIDVENVADRLDIVDSHGDIKIVYSQPPREELNVSNDSGEVDLTVPARSGFEISAVSRSGEVESDFEGDSLKLANDNDTGRLNGKIGARGPKINIATSYGTIYLRKSS